MDPGGRISVYPAPVVGVIPNAKGLRCGQHILNAFQI
jgi:hypothetical protein